MIDRQTIEAWGAEKALNELQEAIRNKVWGYNSIWTDDMDEWLDNWIETFLVPGSSRGI
jgi:hypothetical protein